MLASIPLVIMNGRVYDPLVGRFLSPDPYVQDISNSQSHNNYSYCLNNPLKYTDPTGEIFVVDDILIAAAIGAIINVAVQGMSGNINCAWDYIMDAGVGALAGAGGAFVGQAVAWAITFGGFAWGISDNRNWYSLPDGSKVDEFVVGSAQYEQMADGYDFSLEANTNVEMLQICM